MAPSHPNTILAKCLHFLDQIGIPTRLEPIEHETFLPGLHISGGTIIIDRKKLRYPGDILHEAGHLSVVVAAKRAVLDQDLIKDSADRDAEEMMAIAWSYAACLHIGIDPLEVFHKDGYNGGGQQIVDNFNAGRYIGTPMLQWCKMTVEPSKAGPGVEPYPKMLSWLRE